MIADTITKFWQVYDEYTALHDSSLKFLLLSFLADQDEQVGNLTRPEKGWNHILAWEVLKQHTFFLSRENIQFEVFEGEIIVVQRDWDRNVFCTRIPHQEFVRGSILSMKEREGRIFLPLYEAAVVRAKTILFSQKFLRQTLEFLSKEEEEVWARYT
ncbi:MAG TPA: hypothetical protein VLB02_01530 [Candidatus Paceibacterota bacterium]|nr:hypothetical protein [Candidatus Paceibacterota bacterium]